MNHSRLRELQRGEFRDPARFLVELRALERKVANSPLDTRAKQLRTNNLKEWREAREAALFCYGMTQRIGQPIYLSRRESQDYDFVASWVVSDEQHFAPVQLKEVVPESLNANSSLEKVIQSLTNYADSEGRKAYYHSITCLAREGLQQFRPAIPSGTTGMR